MKFEFSYFFMHCPLFILWLQHLYNYKSKGVPEHQFLRFNPLGMSEQVAVPLYHGSFDLAPAAFLHPMEYLQGKI